MGLILCENLRTKNPFHIEVLSLNIYSFEELCYIIYENPILVTEGIVSDALTDFIENELNKNTLAESIKRKRTNGVDDADILVYIIDSCDLYNNAESILFRNAVAKIKKMSVWEVGKQRADYMFYIGRYGTAKRYYLEILDMDKKSDNNFVGSIYHNLGVTYANLFLYEEAYDAFKKSYELTNDEVTLMELYFLKRIFDSEGKKKKTGEINDSCKADLMEEAKKAFDTALNGIKDSDRLKYIERIFQIENREEKRKLINEYIAKLKSDYRNMK